MPFIDASDMLHGAPLPGWSGRFFHSEHMTFAHWDVAVDAVDLHEGSECVPGRMPEKWKDDHEAKEQRHS